MSMPVTRAGSCASIRTAGPAGAVPTLVTPGSIVPPPNCTSSSATRSAAASGSVGSTPRSNRFDASDGSLCRRPVRKIETGSKCAASMTTCVVVAESSVVCPPMTPARPIGPESSVISRSSGDSVRSTSSRVVRVSPSAARRTRIGPCSRSPSYPWIGWPSSSIT
jgi:hypothetical protein